MSMNFYSTLWILGKVPGVIVESLVADGWKIEASDSIGVKLSVHGNYRREELPRFEDHGELVCVLSMTHEASPDNLKLSVCQYHDYVEGYFDDHGTVCESLAIPAERKPQQPEDANRMTDEI